MLDSLDAITSLMPLTLRTPLTPAITGLTFSEYGYYSQYGKLVVIDVGGVIFPSTPSDGTAWLKDLPVQRTRLVSEFFNNGDRTKSIDVYGVLNGTSILVTRGIGSTAFWGQIFYFTD